jgi:transcriptional regulator with XRE-family HTH domain
VPKPLGADKRRLNRTLAQALGAEITDLRVKQKLSQDQFAHRLGYNETYVRRLERGTANPSLQLLSSVSGIFHLPLSVLISKAEQRSQDRPGQAATAPLLS